MLSGHDETGEFFPQSTEKRDNALICKLREEFKLNFADSKPILLIRAPGRVNIIGEHIDYCGYGVLPMAIDRHTSIMVGKSNVDNRFNLRSTDPAFESHVFDPNSIDITTEPLKWYKYLVCGLYAVKSLFPEVKFDKGLNMLVSGDIPIGCGLSSSSSLVVCSALAIIAAYGLKVTKKALAKECAVVERYVGTAGGGMDQSISCLAEKGMAKYITFNPLDTENVILPNECVLVVANSLSSHHKAEKPQYNTRVVECRVGVKILAIKLKVQNDIVRIPIDFEKNSSFSTEELGNAAKIYLKDSGYSRNEVLEILNISNDELKRDILTSNTQEVQIFESGRRLLHVFREADRVKSFVGQCKQMSLQIFDVHDICKLGCLMNESHSSCRNLYECSSKAQDELVDIMRECGCVGARMTGAGWGGCVVGLIYRKNAEEFVRNVKERFYKNESSDKLDDFIFVSEPTGGANIINLL